MSLTLKDLRRFAAATDENWDENVVLGDLLSVTVADIVEVLQSEGAEEFTLGKTGRVLGVTITGEPGRYLVFRLDQ